jgi:hypothetical protein
MAIEGIHGVVSPVLFSWMIDRNLIVEDSKNYLLTGDKR